MESAEFGENVCTQLLRIAVYLIKSAKKRKTYPVI